MQNIIINIINTCIILFETIFLNGKNKYEIKKLKININKITK
jgi:hypothetical protein